MTMVNPERTHTTQTLNMPSPGEATTVSILDHTGMAQTGYHTHTPGTERPTCLFSILTYTAEEHSEVHDLD